jgi:TonB family protein
MSLNNWTDEEKFGFGIAFGVHVMLLMLLVFITMDSDQKDRVAFIEVELGTFQSGSPAEQAEQQNEQVKTRQQVSETPTEDPEPEPEVQEEQTASEDISKPVDTPDQTEQVESEDIVTTPETEEIQPEVSDEKDEQEASKAPNVQQDEEELEGADETGDVEGLTGETNVDQGTSNDEDKSAPYSLKWEGDIQRSPVIQPLPLNTQGVEAVITIRFQVRPDGSIGRIIPLKKMNPELEQQILTSLRRWKFSELPSGVPQQAQWGTITFRFVME